MKAGDTIATFGDPLKSKYPLGMATLIELIKDSSRLQLWIVEFVNNPDQYAKIFIKKEYNGTK